MLTIDYSLFIQIANFLFLIFLLNIVAYRPIRGILNRRKEEMSSTEEITQDWKRKADRNSEEFENRLLETRNEGLKEKGNIKGQGIEEEREMLLNVYSSVEENIDKARLEIQDKISQARQSLQTEVETFSHELAEKILGRGI